jgi:hypothetical protein
LGAIVAAGALFAAGTLVAAGALVAALFGLGVGSLPPQAATTIATLIPSPKTVANLFMLFIHPPRERIEA